MSKFQDALEKYLDIFKGQETYFANDIRNLNYFKAHPSNATSEDIHQKLSLMDDKEFTRLNANPPMTEHILKLKIDPSLEKGDLSVVEAIANLTINGRKENLLQIASVYCNLHQPDVFPIYSEQYFAFYRRYIAENTLKQHPDDLVHYTVFTSVQNDFLERSGLKGKLNYTEVRKFGWLYADKILKESE